MFARQEKNFMKDPATANARIYVGNLDQKVTEDDLKTLFSPYGKVLGITVQRNFGFIQFENETSAALAIQKELGSLFKGKRLNVRGAITGEGGKGNNNLKNIPPQTTTPTTTAVQIPQQQQQQTSLLNNDHNMIIDNDQDIKDPQLVYPRRVGLRGNNNNNYRDRSPLYNNNNRYQQQQQQQHNRNNIDLSLRDNNTTTTLTTSTAVKNHLLRKKIDCNDCEIIVVAKSLTEYAEYIEHKLKQFGITVDLLFPNEDVPIGRVLANIASRGCLYAILVTPQNEQHHSLTLNILYGLPEEHRNMPTDDAINLINKNFEYYIKTGGIISNTNNTNNNIINKLLIKHSDTIQILLNLLTENRQLTCKQYDIIIKYLQERKDLQYLYEMDTNNININESQQASDLQNRILNILNNTTTNEQQQQEQQQQQQKQTTLTTNTTTNTTNNDLLLTDIVSSVISKINTDQNNKIIKTATTTTTTTTTPPPLLNDPSVQKALDSLLQADLLKNITINTNTSNDNNYGTNYSSNIRRF